MSKPVLILDPDWRRMDELFSETTKARLFADFDVVWGKDGPIPADVLEEALPKVEVLIAAAPKVDAVTLKQAPHLRTIIEVSGAFPNTIDYDACFEAGIEVLSCAPGFRQSVAEMGLAMALAGARGLVHEHEAFRSGQEHWLSDNTATDFTLFGAPIGFIGFGQIAQELTRLLAPFRPRISAYDPWLPESLALDHGVELLALDDVLKSSRCVFVTAVPTSENYHLLNAERLARLSDSALLILLSRAHLVDFDALEAELEAGRIRSCIDVFPSEPVSADATIRRQKAAILSPHRAAAVYQGRQLIGEMILSDLHSIETGRQERKLSKASRATIDMLQGQGDAKKVSGMLRTQDRAID